MIFSDKNMTPFDGELMKGIEEGLIIADGEKPKLITKNITANDTYNSSSDNADGYNKVIVNVANSYTAGDEGKVVSDGALIAQTAYPTEITENDTYDTTNYNSITVNVSGGGGSSFVAATEFDYNNNYQNLLQSIEIPNGVETTAMDCFNSCSSLTSVTIPNSITSLGDGTFYYCSALETVTFESNSNLQTIEANVFNSCTSLTSITIPNSVTEIGESVFAYCDKLETITFESTTPPTLSGDLELNTSCIIRVPQGTLSAYTSAENYPDPSEYIYEEY